MKPTRKDIGIIQTRLLTWYGKNQRALPWRKTSDPYSIWVSEVMLQQTQVNTVMPFYIKFLRRFPTIGQLAGATQQQVLKSWEGLGYYARARNFHRAAQIVMTQHNGIIPDIYQEFKALPGVGDYIAAAVLSIAFKAPYAVVDGNVKRVFSRLFCMDQVINHPSAKKAFSGLADSLLDRCRPDQFNQALMELGALICRPEPQCHLCPLKSQCGAFTTKQVDAYPKKIKKNPTPTHHLVAGVVYRQNKVLITQRKADGLLGGLWEFPGGTATGKEAHSKACLREVQRETGLVVEVGTHLARVRHAYTHFKIIMDVYCCRYVTGRIKLAQSADYRWITLDQIPNFPFHKAVHKFFPNLNKCLDITGHRA